MLSISVANITRDNISKLKFHISQPYPPRDEVFLMELKGIHWKNHHLIE